MTNPSIMKKIAFGILLILSLGCNGQRTETTSSKSLQSKKVSISSLKALKLAGDSLRSYATVKSLVKQKRLSLKDKTIASDSLSHLFTRSLVNRILPFWEGTEWSFEGHTSVPKQGKIACGYFVSTTLKDMGININRYRLAQQNPANEAKSLALNSEVVTISENSYQKNLSKMYQMVKEGIHFIGFDENHVGYIFKEKEQLYLIHSNYINAKGVEIETIENSQVFASYDTFYLTELSTNETLLKYWFENTQVTVVTE